MKKINFLIIIIVNSLNINLSAQTNEYFKASPPVALKWDNGPVSLGMVMDMSLVPASDKKSQDLMISRIWQGVLIYPSVGQFSEKSLLKEPYFVGKSGILLFQTMDWDNDGTLDLIGADRFGFLYQISGKGKYPNVSYEVSEATIMRDALNNLPFNIPFDNPNLLKPDDLGGYKDLEYYNYLFPILFSSKECRYRDLIIGDWAGNLWWLPEQSAGIGKPSYCGIKYRKERSKSLIGINYQKNLGLDHSKPAEKIHDENGQPFLLGKGKDAATLYRGANTRPIVYPDEKGTPGLLVICGSNQQQFFYLRRINTSSDRKPVFKNMGEVSISGLDLNKLNAHCKVCLFENNGRKDLLLANGNYLSQLRNSGWVNGIPNFTFHNWIKGENVTGSFGAFNDILKGSKGNRFIIHFAGDCWNFIPIKKNKEGLQLHYTDSLKIMDQNGVFHVDGETDPQVAPEWGYHRITKWDFDGFDHNHLLAGTDKGLLFLLKDDLDCAKSGKFIFRSFGPLKDASGQVIKIHNRAVAASMDLNDDGRKDLIVGGISYQLGVKSDPHPGGGVYYLLNEGTDSAGLPILSSPKPLNLGIEFKPRMNSHIGLQVLDIDHDGREEVIIGLQDPGWDGRIFHKVKGKIALEYTGMRVPVKPINEHILDIDGDSNYELVSPGGERGVGYYKRLEKISK